MPQPRNHHAAVYCKGALYLLGKQLFYNFYCIVIDGLLVMSWRVITQGL